MTSPAVSFGSVEQLQKNPSNLGLENVIMSLFAV